MTKSSREEGSRPRVSEIIVVEGRDDTTAIKRAVEAETIETHGYGINEDTWRRIECAANGPGIIVLTDPDHAGEMIRRRIMQRFPDAAQVFLPREEARAGDDIGVENASPQAIRHALRSVQRRADHSIEHYAMEDLDRAGMIGCSGAEQRRRTVGRKLGIGYGNGRTMLRRLNGFGVPREEFWRAVKDAAEDEEI